MPRTLSGGTTMAKLLAMCLVAASAIGITMNAEAQTTQTIMIKQKVVQLTHLQCVMERMAHAKTLKARDNAERWCISRHNTVPRRW